MQERHANTEQYFNEQARTTQKYVIPFLETVIKIDSNTSVLEIGCGEAGNLKPFLDLNLKRVVGVDLSEGRIKNATIFFNNHPLKDKLELIHGDIYDRMDIGKFDIIFMRDVIEHIHDQEKFMIQVKALLSNNGKFFLGFPPWYNPFGGHQQICKSKILSKLPYFHILPYWMYKFILKSFGESQTMIENLIEIKDTRISIERFERILKRSGYKKDKREFYFINPNYEVKFGLKPRKQTKLISAIPFLRNFFTTAMYYIISRDDTK